MADLPVGVGLQDHILGAGVNYEAKGPVPVSHYNHSEVYMWERSDSALRSPDMIALYVSVPFASTGHSIDYEHGYCILSGVATTAVPRLCQARVGRYQRSADRRVELSRRGTGLGGSYRAATELCPRDRRFRLLIRSSAPGSRCHRKTAI